MSCNGGSGLEQGLYGILFLALENNPSMEIALYLLVLNYASAQHFPDKAALLFMAGNTIVQGFFGKTIYPDLPKPIEQKCISSIKKN